jgi:ADP-heptose:LPS heptosyltransferase
MRDENHIEAKLEEKIKALEKLIILGEKKLFTIFDRTQIENEISNFNYSQSYFLYKEKEKLISEIKTLYWVLEKDHSLDFKDYLKLNYSTFDKFNNKDKIYIETFGGLGDCLLMTPAFYSLKKNNPNCSICVRCNNNLHYEILKNNPNIECFIDDEMLVKIKDNLICIDVYNLFPSLIYPKRISEIICQTVKTKYLGDILEIYLTEEEISWGIDFNSKYKHPICINPTSACSNNQEWDFYKWEDLVNILSSKGLNILQIGKADEKYVSGCIDLRGQFSLRECIAILNASKCFIGVDSFWQHAASALKIPAIVLFGDSSPTIWGHDNNNNIYKGYECSPCFEILYGQTCPYNKKCMNDISVKEVLDKIESLLFNNLS